MAQIMSLNLIKFHNTNDAHMHASLHVTLLGFLGIDINDSMVCLVI